MQKHNLLLEHYFKSLENILNYLRGNLNIKTVNDKQQEYISIIQSQLSSFEEKILFYRVLANRNKNFTNLVLEYKLLNKDWVDAPTTHWDAYEKMLHENADAKK